MNQLALARKKTKLMSQVAVELLYCKSAGAFTSKRREKLFAKLWDINMMYQDFAAVVEDENYTLDDFKAQCMRMEELGFERDGDDYVPLAVICFAKPLRYMAAGKEKFAQGDEAAQKAMVQEAMDILNGGYADNVVIFKE